MTQLEYDTRLAKLAAEVAELTRIVREFKTEPGRAMLTVIWRYGWARCIG